MSCDVCHGICSCRRLSGCAALLPGDWVGEHQKFVGETTNKGSLVNEKLLIVLGTS